MSHVDAVGDLYMRLGVGVGATASAIKAAYRMKAVQLHPDKGGDPKAFAALQEAYAVLCNSQRRRHYDETGRLEMSPEEQLLQAMQRATDARPSTAPGGAAYGRPASPLGGRAPGAQAPDESATPEPARRQEVSVWLPPALRAAVEGRELERTPVPPIYDAPVPQVTITEREGEFGISLQSAPTHIDEGHLREGEVLVHMLAVPLCLHELSMADEVQAGDLFGVQGVGRVRMVGPKVDALAVGDLVLPLREVDEDGDLREGVVPPGTARTLAVFGASRCARLATFGDVVLSDGHMAVAKSIVAAYHMAEEHVSKLSPGDTVVINTANGVIGQVLVQLFVALSYPVVAVVRRHHGCELTKRKLENLGARKALLDDDDIRTRVEEAQLALPQLAFDGVGGEATVRIASSLSKTGDLVCFGSVSGCKQQVLPAGWGKKWKGAVHQYSIDEWLQRDLSAHSAKLSSMLREVARLMQAGRLHLDIEEYSATPGDIDRALEDARSPGRLHAVVLRFELCVAQNPLAAMGTMHASGTNPCSGKSPASPFLAQVAARSQAARPLKKSWDLDFLEWDSSRGDDTFDKRRLDESHLFKRDMALDERVQPSVEEASAAAVALELGAPLGEAGAVLLWLPGPGEVPEEHAPWLSRLAEEAQHGALRVLVLRPRAGSRWYGTTDAEAVRLGLCYGVVDEGEALPGVVLPPLVDAEIEALQQAEGAALALHRRCLIEAGALPARRGAPLPMFLAGSGQGGAVALYTALCLLGAPVRGVAFCHSAVPVGGMLLKRLAVPLRQATRLLGIYDREDREVPMAFPEALHQMFTLAGCDAALEWLDRGYGHEFCDEAAERITRHALECLQLDFRRYMEAQASRHLKEQRSSTVVQPVPQRQERILQPIWESLDR